VKLHDNFATHLKVLAAGEDAAWLFVSGLLFCSANETDGRIPTSALRMLTAKKDAKTLARILVREGMWEETSTGWLVHDYLQYQRSKAQIEADREANRKRVAKHRSKGITATITNGHVTEPDTEVDTDTEKPPLPPRVDRIVDLVFDRVLGEKERRGERISSIHGFRAWWDKNEAEGCRKRTQWVLDTFDMPSDSHYADTVLSPTTPPWARTMMKETA